MMDFYVKMKTITNMVLHFHLGKWALNYRNWKKLNYRTEVNSSVVKICKL